MLRKKPENRYPYINPNTAQCAGASINRQAQAPMSGAGKFSDNDEAGGYDPYPLPSTLDELRQRRLKYFRRSGSDAVSVAATADPVPAQGHPEVVNAVTQVIVVTEPYTTIPHTPPTIHHYTT